MWPQVVELVAEVPVVMRVPWLDPPVLEHEFYAPPRWRHRAEDPMASWDARWAWAHDEAWERGDCGG